MSTLSEFWQRLFIDGCLAFEEPPKGTSLVDEDARLLFERYFRNHALALAGRPLYFVDEIAFQAFRIVELSAWYLVSHAGTTEDLERDLAFPAGARGPDEHLSADLALQYLPAIYQRARVLFPADRLPALLAEILRRWPLSGVLADLTDPPLGDLEFGGHSGLNLLYAERLVENFKPAWIPRGAGASYVDLAWAESGRDLALLVSAQLADMNESAPFEEPKR